MNRTLCTSSTSLVVLLALGIGCAPTDPNIELSAFADCDAMQDYMGKMARDEVLYDYRWQPGGVSFGTNDMALESATQGDGAGGSTSASTFSETNLQEGDVDESDLVKTDGTWMFSISGHHLVVSQAWPVEDAAQVASVEIDGTPGGLYLYGDLVVVESRIVYEAPDPRSGVMPTRGGTNQRTLVTIIDAADPTAPEVVREAYAVGELKESRRVDDRLFVVTYQDITVAAAATSAREAKRMVKDAEARDWLPWLADNVKAGGDWASTEDVACDCEDVYASDREGGTWLVSVLSIDLDDPGSTFQGSTVVGEAETIYATTSAVYVASSERDSGPFPSIDDQLQTIIHKFDIGESPERPQYVASAKVQGVLDDRFGLSEYDGVLRVATTEYSGESSAVVTTLREEDGQFEQLDQVLDIGQGEEIYATRFTGDLGYVVTYFQVDPLFALDLSDPTDIRVGGHLEMEGWSDYLHPVGDDHLLAVGVGGDWNLQVSLFDVSDLDAPSIVEQVTLEAYGSEAQYDHHAFNYFSDKDVLAIPAWTYDDEPALEVLDATIEGLDYIGRVTQDEVLGSFDAADAWCAPIRRSVIMDDFTYAVSTAGLTAAETATPGDTVQAVAFTDLDPCAGAYDYY